MKWSLVCVRQHRRCEGVDCLNIPRIEFHDHIGTIQLCFACARKEVENEIQELAITRYHWSKQEDESLLDDNPLPGGEKDLK